MEKKLSVKHVISRIMPGSAVRSIKMNRKRKPRAVPERVERLDACGKCGMPFAISAPAAVAGRLHRLWESRHLCEPGRYRPEPAAPVTLAAMLATLEWETGGDDEQTTNKTGES